MVRRSLAARRSRASRTTLAVAALYFAIVLFVGAYLELGFQTIGAGLPDWTALAFELPGTLLLLGAAVGMAAETFLSHKTVVEEIDLALLKLEKDALD